MSDRAEFHCTDLGNAQRLVARHGPVLRYSYEWQRWLPYDGTRWAPDCTGELQRRAKETALSIYGEAAACEDTARRKELAAHAPRSEAEGRLAAMLSLAQSEPGIPVLVKDLDPDPMLLNVLNGTLDLRTGSLRPHDPADLITKLAPVEFQPNATCPGFHRFLDRVLPDPALRAFLQHAVGYSLTGLTTEQVLLFLYGLGSNGKTTLLELFHCLLGDYAVKADASSLLVRRNESPRNDLAALVGARLVTASEANEGARLDEAMVKALTGGDRITVRKLYADYFTFTPTFKIVLAANHKPTITSTGLAIWRRIRLLPFTVTIPEAERDPRLLDTLQQELPGILTWAVEGCVAWQREGLQAPPAVCTATEGYRSEMDLLAPFLEERCEVGNGFAVAVGDLYAAYVLWAERNGERHPLGKKAVGLRLAEHGFEGRKDGQGRRWWDGLKLRLENDTACTAHSGPNPETPLVRVTRESSGNREPRAVHAVHGSA